MYSAKIFQSTHFLFKGKIAVFCILASTEVSQQIATCVKKAETLHGSLGLQGLVDFQNNKRGLWIEINKEARIVVI